jgi:hypothetical protein
MKVRISAEKRKGNYAASSEGKNLLWNINNAMTPVLMDISAKLNTGRKNSKDSPPQIGTQLGNCALVMIGK